MREVWEVLSLPEQVAVVAVLIGTVPANLYPFLYSRVKFWKSAVGWSMMTKGVALALIFDLAVVNLFTGGDFWQKEWWVMIINVFMVYAVTQQVIVFRMVQKKGELDQRLGGNSE